MLKYEESIILSSKTYEDVGCLHNRATVYTKQNPREIRTAPDYVLL
jgi:hypothetical protein